VHVDELVRAIPDPFELAARAGEVSGLSVLASTEPGRRWGGRSFVAWGHDASTDAWDPCEADPGDLAGPAIPRWIGVLPYEARRSLERSAWAPIESRARPLAAVVEWRRYPAVLVVDHDSRTVRAVGASASRVRDMVRQIERTSPTLSAAHLTAVDDEAPELHAARVRAAIELIFAGDLYQVSLARALCVSLQGAPDPWTNAARLAAFRRLAGRAPTPFAALLAWEPATVMSTSPELFLDVAPTPDARFSLTTEPIKGTRPRHADAALDESVRRELDGDAKERAELSMIVDVERNDLARVCEAGTVRVAGLPRVETFGAVHHRVATIVGLTRSGISRRDVLGATWPSGSVTGAPKIRAMEVIASLERSRRGLYTGAIGYAGYDGSLRLSMAIRCAVLGRDGLGTYLTGGGITHRSDPARELEETRWKAVQLTRER